MIETIPVDNMNLGERDLIHGNQDMAHEGFDRRTNPVDAREFMEMSTYDRLAIFTGAIANIEDLQQGHKQNIIMMAPFVEYGVATLGLIDGMEFKERKRVLSTFHELYSQADQVGSIFPVELQAPVASAYGELISNLLFTLSALKNGKSTPRELPLRNGGVVKLGKYTFEEALDVAMQLATNIERLTSIVNDERSPVIRSNANGRFGLYHIGKFGQVLATVRLRRTTANDPSIEYGKAGSEATIDYTIDTEREHTSVYKHEQLSPFSIRIDNELDPRGEQVESPAVGLSLDVGSILAKRGFGKKIADLIALGDMYRSSLVGKNTWLNHNHRPFDLGMAEEGRFARLAAEVAEKLEQRCAATSQRTLPQLVLKQTVDA